MRKIIIVLALMLFATNVWAGEVLLNLPSDLALQKLEHGNARFVDFTMKHPNQTKARRDKLIIGQRPFAVILTCSDSRVPPELIFDQGLGDLFVIRNAGNVLDEHVLGSMQYAIHHLGVKLIVVMGHESCGAVGAAMKEDKETPEIESIKKSIEPAVCACKKENRYTYENVIRTNVLLETEAVIQNKEINEYYKKHGVDVRPAYYNINSGKVDFLK